MGGVSPRSRRSSTGGSTQQKIFFNYQNVSDKWSTRQNKKGRERGGGGQGERERDLTGCTPGYQGIGQHKRDVVTLASDEDQLHGYEELILRESTVAVIVSQLPGKEKEGWREGRAREGRGE